MSFSLRSMVCLAACILASKIFYLPAVDVIEYGNGLVRPSFANSIVPSKPKVEKPSHAVIHASKSPWNDVHKPFKTSMPLGNTSAKHRTYHRIRFRFRRLNKHQERKLRQKIRKQIRRAQTESPDTSNDTSKSPDNDLGVSSLALNASGAQVRSLQTETERAETHEGSPSSVHKMSMSVRDFFLGASALLATVMPAATVCCMNHPFQPQPRNAKLPPQWGPEQEQQYPFSHWSRDILLWSIMSDWDNARKAAGLLSVLTSNAREMARTIPPNVILTGGQINGQAVDGVTYIMFQLATKYGRLGEEQRLDAIQSFLGFDRHSGERIDALLQRFDAAHVRAQEHGGLQLSVQGAAWLLLRAIGVTDGQLMQLLQPIGGSLPTDAQQMEALRSGLRRMGHIIEGSPGNIATALRSGRGQSAYLAAAEDASQWQDQWSEPQWHEPSPWAESQSAYAAAPSQMPDSYAVPTAMDDSGTDSDTSSEAEDPADTEMPPELEGDVTQRLWWAYAKAKREWRRHTDKPVRKFRRFAKRWASSKGKGKNSKGKRIQTTALLAAMKGAGKGKGKGKGRKSNPRGKNGEIMTCHECGSTEHLVARCPQRRSASTNLFIDVQTPHREELPPGIISGTFLMVSPDESSDSSWVDPWSSAAQHLGSTAQQTQHRSYQDVWRNYQPTSTPPTFEPPRFQEWLHADPSATHSSPLQQTPFMPHVSSPQPHVEPAPQTQSTPMAVDSTQALPNMTPHMMPQFIPPGAWYPQPAGFMYGQPVVPQPWYPPHVPHWANMPEFQFVQGTGPVQLPPFQHPIQVSAVSRLDDTQAKVIGEFHETSTMLGTRERDRPAPTTSAQLPEGHDLDQTLRPFIQIASARASDSAGDQEVQEQPHQGPDLPSRAPSQGSSASRASFHGDVRTCTICQSDYRSNEELVRLRCRHTFHEECWSTAVIHDAGMECPTCRGAGDVIILLVI